MGRGLGRLQKAILSYLEDHGGSGYVSDIPWTLNDEEEPPRTLQVSVRRAVKALSQRGLVCTGYHRVRGFPSHQASVVWLPNSQPKYSLCKRRQWTDTESLLLQVLGSVTQEGIDRWFREGYNIRGYIQKRPGGSRFPQVTPPWVPYQMLVQRVTKETGNRYYAEDGGYRAIKRAIDKLVRDRKVETLPGGGRCYNAIRCLVDICAAKATLRE